VSTVSRIPLVDLARQHSDLREVLQKAVEHVLDRGDFVLGEDLERFEREFAAYCGAREGVGVDSGTSALELALRAHGCGPGDEVITAPNSFVATALAISQTGAEPVFVDVDPVTFTLDVERLPSAITSRTKAIVPVHLYGQAADMDPIMELARASGLAVVEDACQAHGARYRGRRVGSLGDAAAFSFYPSKNLGGLGDGGMVVTRDEETADHIRLLRNYGQRTKNHHEVVGFNRRLDTLQAALLRVKLPLLDGWNERRRSRARDYGRLLRDTSIATPTVGEGREHVWHVYSVCAPQRTALRSHLEERGIGTGIHYPRPIHLQPAYRALGLREGRFPVAERLADEVLSLPMYPELSPQWVERVADGVREHSPALPA
jgi:dTDP-4-amino-4,6-dideoxygalactose transaminase